jgi:hypothetical protein
VALAPLIPSPWDWDPRPFDIAFAILSGSEMMRSPEWSGQPHRRSSGSRRADSFVSGIWFVQFKFFRKPPRERIPIKGIATTNCGYKRASNPAEDKSLSCRWLYGIAAPPRGRVAGRLVFTYPRARASGYSLARRRPQAPKPFTDQVHSICSRKRWRGFDNPSHVGAANASRGRR